MKRISIIFSFALILTCLNSCNEIEEKKTTEDLILPNYTVKKFDLDSSLYITIPNNWDSIEYLRIFSYEYKYYITIKSKEEKEGIRVQRLKFKFPTLELTELADYYKNGITTNPAFKEIHLIKQNYYMIDGKNAGSLFYSVLNKDKTVFLSKVFFINADSSNTIIEIETRNSDTSVSYKKNDYIINSIKINNK